MHNIRYFRYQENVDKQKVQDDLDNFVAHEDWQEGACGLLRNIRWIDKIFESYDEAYTYIEEHDRGDYDQLAVKYKNYPFVNVTASKKFEDLRKKFDEVNQENRNVKLRFNDYFKDAKSDYIGCKSCGSKINRIYIGSSNKCPVCQSSMLPPTVLKRIQAADIKLENIQKRYHAECKKLEEKRKVASQKQKPKIEWLVKIEYHT